MTLLMLWLKGLVLRRRGRLIGITLGIALTVGFVASLGSFFAVASANMTSQAIRSAPVDWQVQLAPGILDAEGLHIVRAEPGISKALVVHFGDAAGFRCWCAGTLQTTGAGKVLGVGSTYMASFPKEVRYLLGSRTGTLIAQQTASNLHATVGSRILVQLPNGTATRLRVDGIIDLPAANSLFQIVGSSLTSSPQAPPDNVVIVPDGLWRALYGGITLPGAVVTQIHVKLASGLSGDPSAAYSNVIARVHHLEARFAGGVNVGDNVAALLDAARGDALYADLLFLFLGVPGALLAILLTAVLGASGGDRRRREQSLLRLRGVTPRRIISLGSFEGLAVGVAGCALGLGIAMLVIPSSFRTAHIGASWNEDPTWIVVACGIGLCVAIASIAVPALRDVRQISVAEGRAMIAPIRRPLWARLYLDIVALAISGAIFFRSASSGYQIVVKPEGVSTSSVDTTVFLAPLLFWIGTAMVGWRLSTGLLDRGRRPLTALVRPLAGPLAGVVIASMRRQRSLLSRGLVILMLTSSFAASTAVFNATYSAQSLVDAGLTNGADVAVIAPSSHGLSSNLAAQIERLNGVSSVDPLLHRYAYIGADLQDLYGINPSSIQRSTHIVDSFFTGIGANDALRALARRPDGVLVSEETAQTYLLTPGTLVRLRLQFAADHRFHTVPFHFVGVVREFPTAPHDSFFVTNANYVGAITGDASAQVLLIHTSKPPALVAAAIGGVVPHATGIVVRSIDQQLNSTLSGLSAIDLSGLTRLELILAFFLAIAASGIVLALGLAERRRTYAIAVAIGAKPRQLAWFAWSEAVFVVIGGIILGSLAGFLIADMMTKLLTGVFDPPPDHLSVPVAYLGSLLTVTVISAVAAVVASLRATRRPQMEILRDL